MTKTKSTKRALVSSALALVMCISMLIGSTFAWFTDSVTSSSNKIQSGTLKLDLEMLVKNDDNTTSWKSIKEDKTALFNYTNWEPGYTDVKVLKVENEGSLALKWVAKFVAEKELSALANVIDVYVCPSETEIGFPADRTLAGYTRVGTVAEFVNTIEETTNGTLEAGKEAYLGIALKMQETAGNEYQGLDLGGVFDIQILATQYTSESDSFDDQYDKDALFPVTTASELSEAIAEGKSVVLNNDIVSDKSVIVTENKEVTVDLAGNSLAFTDSDSSTGIGTLGGTMNIVNSSDEDVTISLGENNQLTTMGGTINLDGVNIVVDSDSGNFMGLSVLGGTVNFNSGTITVKNDSYILVDDSFLDQNSPVVFNMNGGEIIFEDSYFGFMCMGNDATVNLNAGTITVKQSGDSAVSAYTGNLKLNISDDFIWNLADGAKMYYKYNVQSFFVNGEKK